MTDMLEQEWRNEVADAVKESGSAWMAFSAGFAQDTDMCFAHLTQEGQRPKTITLSLVSFQTAEARRAEIIRLLTALG